MLEFDTLAVISLSDQEADVLGVAPELHLQRAWPKAEDHLLLDYRDPTQRIVVGQAFADVDKATSVFDATREATGGADAALRPVSGGAVLLQARGADRRLHPLHELASRSGTTVLVHRPERRAVVRVSDRGGQRFVRVMPPARIVAHIARSEHVFNQRNRSFRVPSLLEHDQGRGIAIWSKLGGVPLLDHLRADPAASTLVAVGRALRSLHELDTESRDLARHTAESERAVLKKWLSHITQYFGGRRSRLEDAAGPVLDLLGCLPEATAALVHRDFYDKQVFIQSDLGHSPSQMNGSVGILDFDTLAVGDPALDLGNLIAHLELRWLQGIVSLAGFERAVDAVLSGYGASAECRQRLGAWVDATRLRLACVYAFRPKWRYLSDELLGRLSRPCAAGMAHQAS